MIATTRLPEEAARLAREKLAELMEEKQRLSLDVEAGREGSAKRAGEIEQEISTLRHRIELADLAVKESARRAEEDRRRADEKKLEEAGKPPMK